MEPPETNIPRPADSPVAPPPASPAVPHAAPPIPHPVHDYRSQPTDTAGDATGGLIPYKNGSALAAYYLGLFSLIPLFGIFMGIAAVVLGIRGLRYANQNPAVKGKVHAWIGIICGGFWAAAYLLLTLLTVGAIIRR